MSREARPPACLPSLRLFTLHGTLISCTYVNTGKSHSSLPLPYSSQYLKSQIAWWDSVVCSLSPTSSLLTGYLLPLLGHSHRDQGVARPLPPAVTWTQVIISPFQAAAFPHPVVPRHQPESCCRILLSVPSSMVTIHLIGTIRSICTPCASSA